MWPDRVSNLGPLTYESGESGALPTALRGPACTDDNSKIICIISQQKRML